MFFDKEWDGDEETALKCLDGELETFTDWANGSIYGYYTEGPEGDMLDEACWGFYGYKYVCTEAKEALEREVEAAGKEAAEARYWLEREVVTV